MEGVLDLVEHSAGVSATHHVVLSLELARQLLVAVLTLRDTLMLLTMTHADSTRSYLALCLATLWLVVVLTTTVHSSFEVAGNGAVR